VFGGVVRGERRSGLLKNGMVRICEGEVIRKRKDTGTAF